MPERAGLDRAPTLILASASPRRRQLLAQLGVACRVVPAAIAEVPRPGESPHGYVQRIARDKALAVAQREGPGVAVLAADTEVVIDGETLGKPGDAPAAAAMLRRLSGRTHEVVSAVVLLAGGAERSALSVSQVTFAPLDEAWIRAWCATGEPLDKAGAYGLQGRAAAWVTRLHGSCTGVMGLPLYETAELLRAAGWPVPAAGASESMLF